MDTARGTDLKKVLLYTTFRKSISFMTVHGHVLVPALSMDAYLHSIWVRYLPRYLRR